VQLEMSRVYKYNHINRGYALISNCIKMKIYSCNSISQYQNKLFENN
jgi:hypothetical protein